MVENEDSNFFFVSIIWGRAGNDNNLDRVFFFTFLFHHVYGVKEALAAHTHQQKKNRKATHERNKQKHIKADNHEFCSLQSVAERKTFSFKNKEKLLLGEKKTKKTDYSIELFFHASVRKTVAQLSCSCFIYIFRFSSH